jgi:hypothetical protein
MDTKFKSENLKGRDHLGDLGVDERIILEWVLKNWVMRMWTEFIWLRTEARGRLL